ncbi:hypothetical protein IJH16_00360 [Candidatus Saccharibacteria bacterium]|nr:hypothetical protein [Candidatus Saccharibacteria bacterium]
MEKVDQVNKWAKKSCPKWNKNRLLRKINREKYRNAARKYWEGPGKKFSEAYKSGEIIDTYPWPYSDPEFANWEEDDNSESYTLISDQSLCVVKYATSYCAWKVFETTGIWPQKTTKERLDAYRWVQFLAEAGYHPAATQTPRNGHRYIGINPDISEWGIVVWFEKELEDGNVLVSSYVNKNYKVWPVEPEDFTWVLIK